LGLRSTTCSLNHLQHGFFRGLLELGDSFTNPTFDARPSGITANICQNRTAFDEANLGSSSPTLEWTAALTPADELGRNVGIAGWVCAVDKKPPDEFNRDVPFTHPFHNDWTFYLAPDPQHPNLMSAGNTLTGDPATTDKQNSPSEECGPAITFATDNKISPPQVTNPNLTDEAAFIEFEMEQGLIPEGYWPDCGDRVASLGRLIVDCGHSNYSTEIHPPLVFAKASSHADQTDVKLFSRAFLTSQWFGNQSLLQSLLSQFEDRVGRAAAATLLPPTVAAIPALEAKPNVLSPPFSGLQSLLLTVRPPTPRHSPEDALLLSYHFTTRSGVAVSVFNTEYPDEVAVQIVLDDSKYVPTSLPTAQEITVSFDDVINGTPAGPDRQEIQALIGTAVATNPLFGVVVAKGIKTTRYALPAAQSPNDGLQVYRDINIASGLSAQNPGVAVDDGQPYPMYGWLTLRWRRHSMTAPQAPPVATTSQ
jgi:hypothetical protein